VEEEDAHDLMWRIQKSAKNRPQFQTYPSCNSKRQNRPVNRDHCWYPFGEMILGTLYLFASHNCDGCIYFLTPKHEISSQIPSNSHDYDEPSQKFEHLSVSKISHGMVTWTDGRTPNHISCPLVPINPQTINNRQRGVSC